MKFKYVLYRVVFALALLIFGTLISTKNMIIKNNIYNNIYNSNISFSKIKKIYNNYLGDIIPFQSIIKEKEVFNESLKFKESSIYNNGVKLTLDRNYSIPILNDGIVIFIGNKDNLNKTVIIEDENGVDTYYGNLDNINVKLYDYVSKNDLLGTASNDTLYLLFEKENKYLDYKAFLK